MRGLVHYWYTAVPPDLCKATPHPVHPLCEGGLSAHAGFPHHWVLCHHFFEGLELAVEASRSYQRLCGCALRVMRPRENACRPVMLSPVDGPSTNDYDRIRMGPGMLVWCSCFGLDGAISRQSLHMTQKRVEPVWKKSGKVSPDHLQEL